MLLDIAVFTRGKNEKLINLLNCLKKQTFQDFQLSVFSDERFNLDFGNLIFTSGKNISQKRNLAIKKADKRYLLLLDDDNLFEDDFLENLILLYQKVSQKSIVSPVIYRRTKEKIQSAGVYFSYLLGKVIVNKKIKGEFWQVKGIGGNSLFGLTENFKKAQFDENIGFVREDLDYIYSLGEKGINCYIVNLPIYHQERDKTRLEKSFIQGDLFYRKIKNRDIFVKKHGNLLQKSLYRLYGRWLSLLYWYYLRIKEKSG